MKRILNLAAILMISLGATTVAIAERWTVPQCVGAMELISSHPEAQNKHFEEITPLMKRYFIQQGDFDENTWEMSKAGGMAGLRFQAELDPGKASAIVKQCRSTIENAFLQMERAYE